MRERPRTWPSIRLRRRRHDVLACLRISLIYPHRVCDARRTPSMNQQAHATHAHNQVEQGSTIDPVCGMSVDPHATPHRYIHHGHPYYFCSAGCRTKFAVDPPRYLAPAPAAAPVPPGTIYTCPMHPQIRQIGPGACPICGMALEPETGSAEAAPNPELLDMTRRFWIALVLALPVVALEMGGHLVDLHGVISQTASNWVQ